MPELDDLLGDAYRADQMEHDRPKAVKIIKDAAADPDTMKALRQRLVTLQQTRAARRLGMRDGCHVTAMLCEVVEKALA